MSKISVVVMMHTDICADGKYCETSQPERCGYLEYPAYAKIRCDLFDKNLKSCLGGGPLRCEGCIEAERKAKENS